MLQKLSIRNYAIIDELDIVFPDNLNIITGETGAGKSIIMGALGLILGARADSSVLVNKEKKSVVEGMFLVAGKGDIREFLVKNELDYSDELLVRREIGVNGKSRAFINDTPVILSQLNALSSLLVDLHQQFDTLELGESDFQRQVLDALAAQGPLLETFRRQYRQWQKAKMEWEILQEQKLQFDKEADYNRFQFTELDEAGFRENEIEDIEAELKLLGQSEGIKSMLDKLYYELQESETPLVQQLKTLLNQLSGFASYHP
ncbi:MAG TPA: AAA family ATPase, partial [Chitinophagaceae bacterium]|nr:AAA family ATPase [Chitinophagaceae bacterium]